MQDGPHLQRKHRHSKTLRKKVLDICPIIVLDLKPINLEVEKIIKHKFFNLIGRETEIFSYKVTFHKVSLGSNFLTQSSALSPLVV